MKPQELMTAKQVRTYVGCAPNTLTKAVREGRFPAPALILGRQRWRKADARHNKLWREIVGKYKMLITMWKLWRTCRIVLCKKRGRGFGCCKFWSMLNLAAHPLRHLLCK